MEITRDELLKIARLSHMEISESEIGALLADIDNVLAYAKRVNEVKVDLPAGQRLTNVFRDDVAAPCNPDPLLAQAPERVHDFYVVPKILENN